MLTASRVGVASLKMCFMIMMMQLFEAQSQILFFLLNMLGSEYSCFFSLGKAVSPGASLLSLE